MTARDEEIAQFLSGSTWQQATRKRIAGDASPRQYDRLVLPEGGTAILMNAPNDRGEGIQPFVTIANHLRRSGLSTPEIYDQDSAAGLLLIEDFGDDLFANLMAREPAQVEPLYRAAADVLIHLADVPILPLQRCDGNWLTTMLDPFFGWYAVDFAPDERAAFNELFRPFAEQTASTDPILMLRDYHAENLLFLPDRADVQKVGILDFQDAMLAHPAYDLVSVLQDARRDVAAEVEAKIMSYFLDRSGDEANQFKADYATLGLQRNLRILGIFARLCLRDGKPHYVDFIPRVWGYVLRNLSHPSLSAVKQFLLPRLAEPTPEFLNHLKSRCPKPAHPS